MLRKKNKKLEVLKDLVGSRAAYIEAVKMLELEGEEKDIFLRASLEVNKKNPNEEIIDIAYAILVEKNFQGAEEENTAKETIRETVDDSNAMRILKKYIGTNTHFMEFINKYNPSQEERAVLSDAYRSLKKEPYDMQRIHAAYEIIKKYTDNKSPFVSGHYELEKKPSIQQNDRSEKSDIDSSKYKYCMNKTSYGDILQF